MSITNFEDCTLEQVSAIVGKEMDSVIIVDGSNNKYKALVRRGIFSDLIEESGTYHDLIEKLWFHFNNSSDTLIEDYHVFIPTAGKFVGKYSKRINVSLNDVTHVIQMTIYPADQENIYIFILDELDGSQYVDETLTSKKVKSIQNTYLFSMYIDIVKDTTNSISITEVSDEVMNQQIKYTQWRMMIVNMIWPDDQPLFLERTDPEYLKNNIAPGRTSSFDCLMKNLERKYIWVKLTFCRSETRNAGDYRFVFMVQDINETAEELMNTLKKYEDLASKDTLTSVYNHGSIETEISNAITAKTDENSDPDAYISIMMLDIDFFKRVNDEFGHSVGDVTLVRFVQIISEIAKERNAVVGRWGGEEFVVVLYDTNEGDSFAFAERLREAVANAYFASVGKITCSIGLTNICSDDDLNSAFNRMDKAVYLAKSAGRNCVKSL